MHKYKYTGNMCGIICEPFVNKKTSKLFLELVFCLKRIFKRLRASCISQK